MDKITYLAELAEGLARWVPERDRQDILRYYAEYFEEAGPGREAEVVAELGDPWALSCRLAVEGGFVTQEAANSWTPRRNRRKMWPLVLAGTLAAVVVIGVSVASLAAKVGRFVGGFVGNTAIRQVTVAEGTDYAWSRPYAEYIAGEDMIGGFWSMEDGYLDPFYAIDAEISMGDITITGGEDFTLAIQQSENMAGYTVKWEMQGDTLKITDGSTGSGHVGLDGLKDLAGQMGVYVMITVPEGSCLREVTARTDFGDVFLSDLDVEVKVTAATSMGNAEGYDLRTAQKVELKTDMGNVTLSMNELYDGADIELNTSMGNVEASLGCYEGDCAYRLETDLGKVTVNGAERGSKAERKGNSLYKLDAGSALGNVDVYFDSQWE